MRGCWQSPRAAGPSVGMWECWSGQEETDVEPVPVKSFGNRNNLDPRMQDMPRGACSVPDALQNTKIGIKAREKAASQGCRATFPANCPEGLLQVPKSG